MNDLENNTIFDSNNIVYPESSLTSVDALADWYDYREIITRQDTIIENQSKIYDLVNQGFCFLGFLVVIIFIYNLIKNMIRKQVNK